MLNVVIHCGMFTLFSFILILKFDFFFFLEELWIFFFSLTNSTSHQPCLAWARDNNFNEPLLQIFSVVFLTWVILEKKNNLKFNINFLKGYNTGKKREIPSQH